MPRKRRRRIVTIGGDKFIHDPEKNMITKLRPRIKVGIDKTPKEPRQPAKVIIPKGMEKATVDTPPIRAKIIVSDEIKKKIRKRRRK